MKVLVTGHDGYIGSVMTPLLAAAGHDVVGLDTGLFRAFTLGDEAPAIADDRQGRARRRAPTTSTASTP